MTTKDETDNRWKPRRSPNGQIYCSPACGHGCTSREHEAARTAARRLAKRLGDGWAPHVWENLGWHHEAQKRGVTVRPTGGDSYVAQAGRSQDHAIAATPEEALSLLVKSLDGTLNELQARVAAVRSWRRIAERPDDGI